MIIKPPSNVVYVATITFMNDPVLSDPKEVQSAIEAGINADPNLPKNFTVSVVFAQPSAKV